MQRKFLLSVVSMLALSLLLLLPAGSRADTFNQAGANSRYAVNGAQIQVSVNVSKYFSAAANRSLLSGTLCVASPSFLAYGSVVSEDYSWVTVAGASYKHVVVTSRVFNYIDFTTHTFFQAHMVVELTQIGAHGQGGFRIIRERDNALVGQSAIGGAYTELPFQAGFVNIE